MFDGLKNKIHILQNIYLKINILSKENLTQWMKIQPLMYSIKKTRVFM